MSWTYSQSTGKLTRDGRVVAEGYSGTGIGRNNPNEQAVRNVGPIPQGRYSIGAEFNAPIQGPCVMRLLPEGHDAFGRDGFLIHGDNAEHDASILPPEVREEIAASDDRDLEVVA